MPRENGDVFTAFAQRRQVDANDIEAMKLVFTEQTGLYALFEVLMRGGDDAYVDLDRRLAADAIELAVGEHAQQPRLALGRHVADLNQKQTKSNRSRGIAAVLRAMKGLSAQKQRQNRAHATSTLPVPDSPLMSTV